MNRGTEPADCYFCGKFTAARQLWKRGVEIPDWKVICLCGAQGPIKETSEEAAKAWNGISKASVKITDGCQVCLDCGCVFDAIDDDPTCAACRQGMEVGNDA